MDICGIMKPTKLDENQKHIPPRPALNNLSNKYTSIASSNVHRCSRTRPSVRPPLIAKITPMASSEVNVNHQNAKSQSAQWNDKYQYPLPAIKLTAHARTPGE